MQYKTFIQQNILLLLLPDLCNVHEGLGSTSKFTQSNGLRQINKGGSQTSKFQILTFAQHAYYSLPRLMAI